MQVMRINTSVRKISSAALLCVTIATSLLTGCAAPQIAEYATEKPSLDMRQYFNGTVDAYGVFTDRSGKVVKRFTVVMTCQWSGKPGEEVGILDEDFTNSDGTKDRRVWTLKRSVDGAMDGKIVRYTGTASDVLGEANGEEKGNAFRWAYTLKLPVNGKTIEVQFDDWMYLMNDKVMLNKAVMSKFGFKLGEVTLLFVKR